MYPSLAELDWISLAAGPRSMLLELSLLLTRLASGPLLKNRGAGAGKSLASDDTARTTGLLLLSTTALHQKPGAASD